MIQPHFRQIAAVVAQHLQSAEQSVKIAVGYFTNRQLFGILCDKAAQGLAVEILLPDNYPNNSPESLDWASFVAVGGKIAWLNQSALAQHFCIIDGATALFGSYTWTYRDEYRVPSALLVIEDFATVQDFAEQFEYLKTRTDQATRPPLDLEQAMLEDAGGLRRWLSEEYQAQADYAGEAGDVSAALTLMAKSAAMDSRIEDQRRHLQNHLWQEADEAEAGNWQQVGDQEMRNGNYEAAIEAFHIVAQLMPARAEAFLNIAAAKWKQGKFQEQAEYATKAITIDPQYVRAHNLLGLAYDALRNKTGALKSYTRCIELSPEGYSYYWNRGLVYKSIDKKGEAFADFNKVIELCTNSLQNDPGNAAAAKLREAARKELIGLK
jgi:tetratricopeptide (TPR) repeat protein